MPEHDPVRDAARYRVERDAARDDDHDREPDEAPPPRGRMENRHLWVDVVIDQAIARGEFDDLPLAGKPIPGIGAHDPDWWLKALIEREQISGVLPEAIQLRKDDAVLEQRLDALPDEHDVRSVLEEFNARVVSARRQLMGGPPVVTPLRDVGREVERWRGRRAVPEPPAAPEPARQRRRWRRRASSD